MGWEGCDDVARQEDSKFRKVRYSTSGPGLSLFC